MATEVRLPHVVIETSGRVTVDGVPIVNQRVEFIKEPNEPARVTLTFPVIDNGTIEGEAAVYYVASWSTTGPDFLDATGPTRPAALRALADAIEATEVS